MAAASAQAQQQSVEQFLSSLKFEQGQAPLPEAGASIRLSDDFRFLGAADAQRVLEDFWGNPPDDSVLGMIVPTAPSLADEHSWAVVITYSDDGHVSDEDAASIDYDALLADMQAETREANEARRAQGYAGAELIGWAAAPRYDGSSRKLYWAKELAFDGSPSHTLNYDIRVLGRAGYLSLNAVASHADLAAVEAGMGEVLGMVEFDEGNRYADFNPDTDHVAGYGLAALVGGVAASKAGLFAKLGILLLKFKKLVILLVVGAGYLVQRVASRRKPQQPGGGGR